MFNNAVLKLFNNPKNPGRISKPDGIANTYNADETAHVEFSLRIENGIITLAQFRAQANPLIVAVCSTITQMLKGKMISMLLIDSTSILKDLDIDENVDIDFCLECVKMAVADYKEKQDKLNKHNPKTEQVEDGNEEPIQEENEIELPKKEVDIKEKLINTETLSTDVSLDALDDDFGDDFFLDGLFDEEE